MENAMEGAVPAGAATGQEGAAPAAEAATAVAAGPTEASVTAAHFEELAGAMGQDGSAPLAALYDLTLPVAIELGRTAMSVQEVLHLGRGAVIELDRLAGEPVDVYVGDRRFAEGEVVVLGENFGVRITRILPVSGGEAG